jgi:HEAT repeat protein
MTMVETRMMKEWQMTNNKINTPHGILFLFCALGCSIPIQAAFSQEEPTVSPPAIEQADSALSGTGEPDAETVERVVQSFGDRRPAVREAAIRRLMPYPEIAKREVLKALREPKLSAQLCALELLREWKAPLGDLDPWWPETVTDARLAKLKSWAEKDVAKPAEKPKQLTAEQWAEVRHELDRLVKGGQDEADAVSNRLSRLGAVLLPEVTARLKQTEADEARGRLLTLRYRLAAADALELRWPGGVSRLAAADSRIRQQAADELAQKAVAEDLPLLRELFSNPDPLVREIALRGLQHIGGEKAVEALVELLADPEPNVRAAVLKQLEQTPNPAMAPKVAEYLKKEQDQDLVVHAIRFMEAVKGREAMKSLLPLLKHPSWQVRAEAAAALGKNENTGYTPTTGDDEASKFKEDVCKALIRALDDSDSFVVGKAMEGLVNFDLEMTAEPMVKAAQRHPELMTAVVEMMARGRGNKGKAIRLLRDLTKHADPRVRATALRGLAGSVPNEMQEEILASLEDAETPVRTAGAEAFYSLLEQKRSIAVNIQRQEMQGARTFAVYETPVHAVPAVPSQSPIQSAIKAYTNLFKKKPKPKPLPPQPASKSVRPELRPVEEEPARKTEGQGAGPLPGITTPAKSEPAQPTAGAKNPPRGIVFVAPTPAVVSPANSVPLPNNSSAPQWDPSPASQPTVTLPPIVSTDLAPIAPDEALPLPPVADMKTVPSVGPGMIAPPTFTPGFAPPGGRGPAEKEKPDPEEKGKKAVKAYETWLKEFAGGKDWESWWEKAVPRLEKMVQSADVRERLAAAKVLIALGRKEKVLPVLSELVKSDAAQLPSASRILPWLGWEDRLRLFRQWLPTAQNGEAMLSLISGLAEVADSRMNDTLWELTAREDLLPYNYQLLGRYLWKGYTGQEYYFYNPSQKLPQQVHDRIFKDLAPRIEKGPEKQRLVALGMAANADPAKAQELAGKLVEDSSVGDDLRQNAFQIYLALEPNERKRTELAVAALKEGNEKRRMIALRCLVLGPQRLSQVGEIIYMVAPQMAEINARASMKIPEAPPGLKAEHLTEFLKPGNAELAAYAGYLLTLLDDRRGIDPLLAFWQKDHQSDAEVTALVYRAIAKTNDPKHVPLLKEIAGKMQNYELPQFYWTIRGMKGPEVEQFRKELKKRMKNENISI